MEKMKLSFQKDVTYGFSSWPQRNFTCSFCKQEYKSAQALGGHMNVHRRDRAKLMRELSPSSYALNSYTNPNPKFSSPTNNSINVISNPNIMPNLSSSPKTSKLVKCFSYGKPLIPSFGSSGANIEEKKCLKKKREDECWVLKKRKNILKIDEGVKLIKEDKQEVDLELRLGFS